MTNEKITSEMREILLVMLLDKLTRLAREEFKKAIKEKQRKLTSDEELEVIDSLVYFGTVMTIFMGASVEELVRCIDENFS